MSAIKLTYANYKASDDLLKHKTIIITGAGAGIGRSAAISYAKYGAQLILLSKTREKLENIYDEISALKKDNDSIKEPIICQVDLLNADEAFYQGLVESLENEFGVIDGLLHNASMLGDLCEFSNYPLGIWQQVMQTNVTSVFMLTKACLPLLKKSSNASIVFTSSSVARKGRAYWGAYAVSKFAIEGFMQSLAEELENTTHIRVNSLNPGATQTTMRATAFPGEIPNTLPHPDDIMQAYLLGYKIYSYNIYYNYKREPFYNPAEFCGYK